MYICVRVCVCVCTCEVAEDRTPISSGGEERSREHDDIRRNGILLSVARTIDNVHSSRRSLFDLSGLDSLGSLDIVNDLVENLNVYIY